MALEKWYNRIIEWVLRNKLFVIGGILNIFFSVCIYKILGGTITIPKVISWNIILEFVISAQILIPAIVYTGTYALLFFVAPYFFMYFINIIFAHFMHLGIEWIVLIIERKIKKKKEQGKYDNYKANKIDLLFIKIANLFHNVSPTKKDYRSFMLPYYRIIAILMQFYVIYDYQLSGTSIFSRIFDLIVFSCIGFILIYATLNGVYFRVWSHHSSIINRLFTIHHLFSTKKKDKVEE